jgi:diguanylate cyclase (GGDEF)-like protein
MQGHQTAEPEASTDMTAAPETALGLAEQALAAGDCGRCIKLAEPLMQDPRQPARAERARLLLAQAWERRSDQCAAAGDHALALQHFRRFHQLHVESLQLRLARGESQIDGGLLDPLTGLASREALDLRLPQMMRRALVSQRVLCLVQMELDPLQPARLALTPALGDGVLREVGALLLEHSRAKDLALRYAGESMVMVLSDVELSTARTVCERIRRAVQTHDWTPLHAELRVTLSLGLTALRSGDSVAQLLARAEAGLISARRDGRNCVRTGVLS